MKQYKLMGALALTGAFALALSGCATGTTGGSDKGDSGEAAGVEMANYNPQPRENLKEGGTVNFAIREGPAAAELVQQRRQRRHRAHRRVVHAADHPHEAGWHAVQERQLPLRVEERGEGRKTVLTFTFTDEAHWNDGTDMDWTAIDATWKANRSYDEGFNPNATDGYKDIESVEQGDTAKTAIVTFKGEFAWPQMPFNGGVMHPALADPTTFNEAMIENPHPEWGAGPYTINEFDANKGYVSSSRTPSGGATLPCSTRSR